MQIKFKFNRFKGISTIIIMLVLAGTFSKMIKQAIEFREYYWYMVILFVIQYIYRTQIKSFVFMMFGVPAIIISNKNITINEKGYTIEWSDIQDLDIVVTSGKGQSYILNIKVKEPWKYISQTTNPVMKYYRWYMLDYYNPFSINLSSVEGDSSEVYATIENYYRNYHKQKWPA